MTKYQKYFQQMINENKAVFAEFDKIHEAFKSDDSLQAKFNELGEPVVAIIRDWERRLCLFSEKGMNAKFSANLAEKFWAVVRERYSHIDLVGCE